MVTPKTLSFLRSLKRNNNREWFAARKELFEAHCRAPMVAIVERLAIDMRSFAPELIADARGSLFRQYRDTRFSEDKTPMKTNIAATFPHRALGRMNGASFYFEIGPDYVWIGGGVYRPDSAQLYLLREHIAGHHERLDAIVKTPAFRRLGGLRGDTLTRVPRGFDKAHPAARYLMHKQFMAYREEPAAFATSKDFYKDLAGTFRTLAPLVRFMNEPLIAAESPGRKAHILDE
ncbi:MAG: DUF2461 domain-containing protein [Vicinamibacterales bacterium]